MKKNFLAIGLLLFFAVTWIMQKKNSSAVAVPVIPDSQIYSEGVRGEHNAGFSEYKKIIETSFAKENKQSSTSENTEIKIGITSHHLPTAAPLIADLYRALANSSRSRNTFVVIGPDHYEKCPERVTIGREGYNTPFGKIETDEHMVQAFEVRNFQVNEDCLEGEHSIGVQAVFIKYLFPDAKIVPIVLSSAAKDGEVEKIAQILSENSEAVTVIASIDFSHHNYYKQAQVLDAESERKIKKLSADGLTLKYVDSPASLKIVLDLAKKMEHKQAEVISRANTYDFTKKPEDATGYMSTVFKK